jgi:hypothetical protein
MSDPRATDDGHIDVFGGCRRPGECQACDGSGWMEGMTYLTPSRELLLRVR